MAQRTCRGLLAAAATGILAAAPGACVVEAQEGVVDSTELLGEEEEGVGAAVSAISGSYPVGTALTTTADLNLRSGPATSYGILAVMPRGSAVRLAASAPSNTVWYQVGFNGLVGWASGGYLAEAPSSTAIRDLAVTRARAGVGFSYWWGHGRFLPQGSSASTAGSCSGSCPSCAHGGAYGGDCSGFVAKVWQVPGSNTDLAADAHPYSTGQFNVDSSAWSTIARGDVRAADAMVYNADGAGHIFLYSSSDPWGSMYAYECRGCSSGCVYNLRTASSAYHAIRRVGY